MIIELLPILDIKYKSTFLSEPKRDAVLNDSIFIFLPRDKSRKTKFFSFSFYWQLSGIEKQVHTIHT